MLSSSVSEGPFETGSPSLCSALAGLCCTRLNCGSSKRPASYLALSWRHTSESSTAG